MEGRTIRESRVVLSQLMEVGHANNLGNVHGGVLLRLADTAGGLAASRHARRPAVTVTLDAMWFREPVFVGELVTVTAEVTFVGRTSMETEIQIWAENLLTGERRHTSTAYAVYVALDDEGNPCPVPPLIAETPEEAARMEAARKRREERLRRWGRR